MKTYEARIKIHAPAEKIWAVLTDTAAYPTWNTTVDKVEGKVALGEKLKIWAKISPGRAFPAKVTELEPGVRMVWSFSAPLGIFKGARSFTLEPSEQGTMVFHTREVFSGWLAGLITKKMPDLQPTFDAWAQCLKQRSEQAD
jgi:uncharacterized protein YndB with AHSA1/START domain